MIGYYGGDLDQRWERYWVWSDFVFENLTKIEQNQNNCFLSSHLGQLHRSH
jgi:hypothetical protein